VGSRMHQSRTAKRSRTFWGRGGWLKAQRISGSAAVATAAADGDGMWSGGAAVGEVQSKTHARRLDCYEGRLVVPWLRSSCSVTVTMDCQLIVLVVLNRAWEYGSMGHGAVWPRHRAERQAEQPHAQ
jgi:hypothetical protein